MKSRIGNIVEILLKENKICTAKEISLKIDVSEKTVREEIARYCDEQRKYPVKINMQKGGYEILPYELPKEDILCFLQKMDEMASSRNDREQYILKKILLNEHTKLESLADELFISIPTINRDFKNVKNILSAYHLKITSKPGYGVSVSGDEMDRRLCYVHCLSQISDKNVALIAEQCGMKEEDFYHIDYVIRRTLDTCEYELTETGIKNLTIHLMYAITRMKKGCFIERTKLNYPVSEKETEIAEMIISDLEEEHHLTFPATEIDYVRIHLLSKRANLESDSNEISPEIVNIIYCINSRIKDILGYDLQSDLELLAMLALHIEPMLSRIKFGINMPNPVLKEVKAECPAGYECAVIAAEYFRENYNLSVSDDELGYLSLHYNLAVDRIRDSRSGRKILVVCGSGAGTARVLQRKLENRFQISRDNIVLCSIRKLRTMDLSDYSFIVSSVKIPFTVEKKVIYIDDILSDISIDSNPGQAMLRDFVDDRLVFLNQNFKTRKEIIDFLCSRIMDIYGLDEEFKELVCKREELSSTDIGNFVAIPHAFSICTDSTVFALCTLKKAIHWKQRKVKYIFLVSFGKNDLEKSHDVNERLMALLMDSKWISLLDAVNTIEDFKNILL